MAGGIAGAVEALSCQPFDTVKVRMQLARSSRRPGAKARGFISTLVRIASRETPRALYRGLNQSLVGIVPKMSVRFASFDVYKRWLAGGVPGKSTLGDTFLAGLGAGVTEAALIVTPMEVVRIRLQAQHHSLSGPLEVLRYRSAPHTAYTVVREEGLSALYRGVGLTALRQATNQGTSFTVYQGLKNLVAQSQPDLEELPSYQHMVIGFISGAVGPVINAPIDAIKTRLQKSRLDPRKSSYRRILEITRRMWRQEQGIQSFYRGVTPRILRVAPGQAVVFAVYERATNLFESYRGAVVDDVYS
ncbi:hypothetical protein JAAARDRAFT_37562 [Jaapia argillacea MUCL 33604]|uniref:Succinate/fumarate mitochondrial transporter n=1 Tax=Jaapia argillacea MUCL 33604 TaxID=933084 RepID=A0A067PUS9_9AGAM|nr:hypothetical protein JAAARDRAFT_37562 [Jaapia argillacea MUCL 33604]